MTITYTYRQAIDATPTFDEDLDAPARLGDVPGLTELAEHMQSGSTNIIFDDPDADLGHSGDAILGQQRLLIQDDACSAPTVYYGFIGIRGYRRGDSTRSSLVTGVSRQIEVELHDYNAYASFRVMPQSYRDAIRPRESVDDRFAWIIGTGYLADVQDTGYIASNTTMMDKADYRGQRPVNVINDCELAAGFGWNAFIFIDDTADSPAWFFDNANTSTAFSSTLRISNLIADVDTKTPATFTTGTTFFPSKDAKLSRDPTELGDSAYLPYRNGAAFRTRSATTATYGQKDIVAPNANVGSKARAEALADGFLFQHRNEEDRITVTVEVPPSKVNLIKAGHRMQVKFQHLPGYEDWRWCRVLRRAPGVTRPTPDRYEMELELSPVEAPCEPSVLPTFAQHKYVDGDGVYVPPNFTDTFTFTAPTTPGNLVVVAAMSPVGTGPGDVLSAPAGWNWAIQNEDTADAGNHNRCNVYWKTSTGETAIDIRYAGNAGGTNIRYVMAEYAGLGNPALFDSDMNREDPGPGFATAPTVSYPGEPCAVVEICFMEDGPTGSDDLFVDSPGTLRTAIAGGLHGSGEVAISDSLLDTTSGTTSWNYGNTSTQPTLTVGLVFKGAGC